MSPDDRRQTFMKLTASSAFDKTAELKLTEMKEKRLNNLVEFQKGGGGYTGPQIQIHTGLLRNNLKVVTNESHNRSTNPGFSRSDGGRQYAH